MKTIITASIVWAIVCILAFGMLSTCFGYERSIVVNTLYNECAGESFDGKVACMNVIQSRAKLEGVALDYAVLHGKYGRFSGAHVTPRIENSIDRAAYRDCEKIVQMAENGTLINITDTRQARKKGPYGAIFFENTNKYGHPSWYKKYNNLCLSIGNHNFYN